MEKLLEFECDIDKLNKFSFDLAKKTKVGDLFLLKGDLGSGKTTFSRSFINSLFEIRKYKIPDNIKSPSFPIMISYSLKNFEIYHYDLFRIDNKSELNEIEIFEELKNNISIIEWPEIILENFEIKNYYLIEFTIVNINKRLIKLFFSEKNKI